MLRLSLFAMASGLLFGVDLGSIGAALQGIEHDMALSTLQTEAVAAGAKGGAIAGCLFGGALMAAHGRRLTVAVACAPFIAGPLLVMLSMHFWQMLVGRMLMGLGIGLASVAAPCYLSEVSQPAMRGIFVALFELPIAIGFLLTSLVNYAIENEAPCTIACWRYQAGLVPLLAAFPLLLAVAMVPESPRWLISTSEGEAARLYHALQAIQKLRCQGASERLTLHEAIQSGTVEFHATAYPNSAGCDDLIRLWDVQHLAAGSPLFSSAKAQPVARASTLQVFGQTARDVFDICRNASHVPTGAGRGLALAIAAAILDQACASTSVLVYAQTMLKTHGVSERAEQDALAMAIVAAKVIGVAGGLIIIDLVSRRSLLAWGGAVSTVFLVILAIGAACSSLALILVGMSGFVLAFYASWGVGYWVIVTEVTNAGGPRFSSASQAASTATLFAAGWLTSFTFVSITSLGPLALLTYAGVTALMVFYATCWLPDLRGQTLEECAGSTMPEGKEFAIESDPESELSGGGESQQNFH